jgi:hypothetical protein
MSPAFPTGDPLGVVSSVTRCCLSPARENPRPERRGAKAPNLEGVTREI